MTVIRSRTKSGSKIMLIFGLVAMLFSVIFIPLGARSLEEERRFDAEGISAPAIVTSKRVHERREWDRETKREKIITTYYLTYAFTTDQGQPIETENSVSKTRWEKSTEQESLQVQHLPTDPTKNRIAGESDHTTTLLFVGLSALGGLIGLGCILTYIWKTFAPSGKPARRPDQTW
ncbi:DUF3592 domain-containing protein [Phragmitibacter flavus]|uniref:DUF3592 domain-containing protein n=1 Tax=Phragmitibacter flavus TaxID=2576071 RepID=A0A5R8KDY2_9BACT|nr:DUF3592 domain-containing protein [Phragmitibacter flavus]TLD70514.1 DUF3592 domain-containing protein [Phragmitibacter flavus]